MSRISAAQRAKSSIVAEQEIMRFAQPDPVTGIRPHALWHKYVHNVELDPIQVLKMQEMDDTETRWTFHAGARAKQP